MIRVPVADLEYIFSQQVRTPIPAIFDDGIANANLISEVCENI
jgi:hypothetical protein